MTLISPARRRALLQAGLGLGAALLGPLPRRAAAAVADPHGEAAAPVASRAAAGLREALDGAAESILQHAPEQATSLGIDRGARAALKSRLAEVSLAARADWSAELRRIGQRLDGLDRAGQSAPDLLRLDSLRHAVSAGTTGAGFAYGNGAAGGLFGGANPYVLSQQDGSLFSVPEFLDSQHQVASAEDAEAWLARLAALARQLDQEVECLRHDAALGVVPPAFIAETALRQLRHFRAIDPARQRAVLALAERTTAASVSGDWAARAGAVMARQIYPALDRQIDAFAAAAAHAAPGAGVQRLPDGDAYYHWALGLGTTTTQSADEIHRIGLDQNAELQARMDRLLRAQGLREGSVGARVQALNSDPRFLYPDSDAGRADLIAYLNDCLARIRPLLPQLSHLGLRADVTVRRVPVEIQDGAPLGYMNFAALDGSRPAIYYVNLKSTALWPKYQLPTLTAHEGVPGHTWQGAYLAEHHDELPLISSLLGFNAFVEGWALYAEQLVAEHGLYADDPFGEIGYLQAQQFRACRLVADTGLHAKGWSREQTVQFLVEQTGRGPQAMTSETDRYCASPGQACGYKTGHNAILRLREQARTALGQRFDLAAFNDVLVGTGGVPLTLLDGVIRQWLATSGAA